MCTHSNVFSKPVLIVRLAYRCVLDVHGFEDCIDPILIRIPFAGDDRSKAPPDPIPNSEVKLEAADGTAGVTLWESRSRRHPFETPSRLWSRRGFSVWAIGSCEEVDFA